MILEAGQYNVTASVASVATSVLSISSIISSSTSNKGQTKEESVTDPDRPRLSFER